VAPLHRETGRGPVPAIGDDVVDDLSGLRPHCVSSGVRAHGLTPSGPTVSWSAWESHAVSQLTGWGSQCLDSLYRSGVTEPGNLHVGPLSRWTQKI
jgi:hypothetical protein